MTTPQPTNPTPPETQAAIQAARDATDKLRDFARDHGMSHFQRDPLVMAIHDAIDLAATAPVVLALTAHAAEMDSLKHQLKTQLDHREIADDALAEIAKCVGYTGPFVKGLPAEVARLRQENERLRAALPKTADGVTIVPDMELWAVRPDGSLSRIQVKMHGRTDLYEYDVGLARMFSTREAALAAAPAQPEAEGEKG